MVWSSHNVMLLKKIKMTTLYIRESTTPSKGAVKIMDHVYTIRNVLSIVELRVSFLAPRG